MMIKLVNRYLIVVLILAGFEVVHAQKTRVGFNGQLSGWATVNLSDTADLLLGGRFIPSLSVERTLNKYKKLDAELSVNTFGNRYYSNWDYEDSDAKLKPYRLWLRYTSTRFELRAGLQKINFGSASMFRPLMWFDRIDPRDPLQLTDGVYGLLGRYYFQNNANIWLWALYGNEDTKGWELVPSDGKEPEFGGRIQLPVLKGEAAISYHHRTADFSGLVADSIMPARRAYPEDRLGIDGKWDLGPGLWFEYVLQYNHPDNNYMLSWVNYLNVGIDYTFGLGNGLNMMTEFFRFSNADEPFGKGISNNFSVLSANYPLGLMDRISCMVYYSWGDQSWYRFINLQRQYDYWSFYLFAFWNPEQFDIYNINAERNLFAGKGFQFMAVYNFDENNFKCKKSRHKEKE